MPHKRNPIASTVILAVAQRAPGLVAQLVGGLVQEHERATGAWQAEPSALAELCLCASGALAAAVEIAEGLRVFPDAMAANIAHTGGLIFAERLAGALANTLGRQNAHGVAERLSGVAADEGRPLRDVALADATVQNALGPDVLAHLFEPKTYLGLAATPAAGTTATPASPSLQTGASPCRS